VRRQAGTHPAEMRSATPGVCGWPIARRSTGYPARMLSTAAWRGGLAGLAGVAVMTAAEKVEQRITGRPGSFVPARTLLTLVGRRPSEANRPLVANLVMHYGTGAALGVLRGVWSEIGLRGPGWSLAHSVVRLSTDQTLENSTGAGSPPATWPRRERAVDVLHKTVYSLATGWVTDRWVADRSRPRPGRLSH
jgi:hypothetical protein